MLFWCFALEWRLHSVDRFRVTRTVRCNEERCSPKTPLSESGDRDLSPELRLVPVPGTLVLVDGAGPRAQGQLSPMKSTGQFVHVGWHLDSGKWKADREVRALSIEAALMFTAK